MAFRVGQKVVCTFHFPAEFRRAGSAYAEKDAIYTIRGMYPYSGKTLLLLAEVVNTPRRGMEDGFNSIHFRPVSERKTDISIFNEILCTTKAPSKTLAFTSAEGCTHD